MTKAEVEYKGVKFEVTYYHQPSEPEVRYYSDGTGYPGCAEHFEIENITFKGEDFTELLENNFEEIEELISEQNEQ